MRDFSVLENNIDMFLKEAQAAKPQPPADLLARYRANPKDSKVKAEYRNWARSQAEAMAPKVKTTNEQLRENLALRNTASRAGQVITHGVTDMASGWADLVGAHGIGDRIRSVQGKLDNKLDSYMTKNMRNEYRDHKTGRLAGEIGSTAIGALIPMPKGGKLFSKGIPNMLAKSKLFQPTVSYVTGPGGQAMRVVGRTPSAARQAIGRVAGKVPNVVNGAAAKALSYGGKHVSKMRGPVARAVGGAMTRATPGMVAGLASAGNVVAGIRGTAPELRQGTNAATGGDYEGNRNLVTRAKDWLNGEARAYRVMHGSDLDHEIYRDWDKWYKKRFSPEGEKGLLPMLRDGKPVYPSDASGALMDTPWQVHGTNGQKLYNRWMDIENAYGASKETNPFSASVLGKLFGHGQPEYHRVPALTQDENGHVQITPRPIIGKRRNGSWYSQPSWYEQVGADLDRRLGTGDNLERAGAAVAPLARGASYAALPHVAPVVDIYQGARSGNWGEIGAGAAMLGASHLPLVGPYIARHPALGTIGAIAAGYGAGAGAQEAGRAMAPNTVPAAGGIRSPYVPRAVLETLAAEGANSPDGRPYATPGYFSNTKE